MRPGGRHLGGQAYSLGLRCEVARGQALAGRRWGTARRCEAVAVSGGDKHLASRGRTQTRPAVRLEVGVHSGEVRRRRAIPTWCLDLRWSERRLKGGRKTGTFLAEGVPGLTARRIDGGPGPWARHSAPAAAAAAQAATASPAGPSGQDMTSLQPMIELGHQAMDVKWSCKACRWHTLCAQGIYPWAGRRQSERSRKGRGARDVSIQRAGRQPGGRLAAPPPA